MNGFKIIILSILVSSNSFAAIYNCSFVDLKTGTTLKEAAIDTTLMGHAEFIYQEANVQFLCATTNNSSSGGIDLTCSFFKASGGLLFENPATSTNVGAKKLGLSGSIENRPFGIDCQIAE